MARGSRDSMTTKAERRTAAAQRSAPELRNVSDRDVQLLGKLAAIRANDGRSGNRGWARVRDVGGEFHSWHANGLVKLHRHGLVDRRANDHNTGRVYKITDKGRRVLAAVVKVS